MRAALKAWAGEVIVTYLVGRAWLEFVDRVAIAKEKRRARRRAEQIVVLFEQQLAADAEFVGAALLDEPEDGPTQP